MADSHRNPDNGNAPPGGRTVRSAARRRLIQAGISAGPVMMTVVSRPVLAQTGGFCQSPSGFVSGNASQPGGGTCAGYTPGYWKNYDPGGFGPPAIHPWPVPYAPIDAYDATYGYSGHDLVASTFCKYFACNATAYPTTTTLLAVLTTTGGPPDDVGRHIVAALLNFAAGFVPATILPKATILDIWQQYITTGFYYPNGYPNPPAWDHQMIVDYLLTTMPI
jgi:hypothetical protein